MSLDSSNLIWLYVGLFAGILSSAVEEPAYANLFLLPFMLAVGAQLPVIILSSTISTAISGLLNLIYQRLYGQGPVFRIEYLRGLPALLGVISGAAIWAFLNWEVLRIIVSLALVATGIKIVGVIRGISPRRRALRGLVNFVTGFLDVMLGTSTAFAVVKAFFADVEALMPLFRTAEAATSIALKRTIAVGGVFSGIGVFLGQRLVHCGRSIWLRYIIGPVIIATGIYILIT
ncbi:MAG: hypothetical protein QXP98_04245 [Thermoproteus sp.]